MCICALLLSSTQLSAQCAAPNGFGLQPPQSSTDISLRWLPVSGASQYQIRYWATANANDKTIVEALAGSPFTLRGLKKSTQYSLEIRAMCGQVFSNWSPVLLASTANSSGTCAGTTGVLVKLIGTTVQITWTSTGPHSIRYRAGSSGDWTMPVSAMSVTTKTYSFYDLPPGIYQFEIQRNCSATGSIAQLETITIPGACDTPLAPTVTPGTNNAVVALPQVPGVLGYDLEYRLGTTGNWLNVGNNIQPQNFLLDMLLAGTQYSLRIRAVCLGSNSVFSAPSTFTTAVQNSCLANKDHGKNLSQADIADLNHRYNNPSPFTFGSMIGVNDGGLVLRSFRFSMSNPIVQLTAQLRNFHTMDEDFNPFLIDYNQNLKPRNTIPEGTPAHMDRNKDFYTHNRQVLGFNNITGSTELLQYWPQSWKEKIYRESDWSVFGPAGIRVSYGNYTRKFIDELAYGHGGANQMLLSNYQVGNEVWDYPVRADYHNLLLGAWDAFLDKYGPKANGGWKMNLVAGAFQAYRDNTCNSLLRDNSNCGGALERHDFIGDYLDVAECGVLRDLHAIDCHPYSVLHGTSTWTYPEDPNSEAWQIRNLAAWRDANRNATTGVLQSTQLWSSEYGFDSNPITGVGERTQSAYLLRGLMLHSRYHYEKVFFYNAYDLARPSDQAYTGLYNSSGFWKQGTHPSNPAWPSPLVEHGASPKPSWFGMLDFKTRFGDHVFFKALVESQDLMVVLLAKPDGSEPHLVFWSPRHTTDANIDQDIVVNQPIDWSGVLPQEYAVESHLAQVFADSGAPGQSFSAGSSQGCETLNLSTVRRNPAFLRLVPCNNCPNLVSFERIAHNMSGCNPNSDYYFELEVNQVSQNDQILLSNLPANGINIPMCLLNGVPFDQASFNANIDFVNSTSLLWKLDAGLGQTQRLRLYYCWANTYPTPVNITHATSACSGQQMPCAEGFNDEVEERSGRSVANGFSAQNFSVMPNPGTDRVVVRYEGAPSAWANLLVFSTRSQAVAQQHYSDLEEAFGQWEVDTRALVPGMYFICLQTEHGLIWQKWEKM